MLPKDYVRFRLTGERAIDMADASGTLMLDVAEGNGRKKCFKPRTSTSCSSPPLRVAGSLRTVSAEGAADTGLQPGHRLSRARAIRLPGHRHGHRSSRAVSATIGTSGVVFAATVAPRSTRKAASTPFATRFPGAGTSWASPKARDFPCAGFAINSDGHRSIADGRIPTTRCPTKPPAFLPEPMACCGRPI